MPEITDAELAEIEARAKAATEGPWRLHHDVGVWYLDRNCEEDEDFEPVLALQPDTRDGSVKDANLHFIAAARADIPALIAALRESREQMAKIGSWAHPDGIDAECYLCGETHGRNTDRDAECPCPAHALGEAP